MRFSEAWLRETIDPPIGSDELVEQLTMAGIEVDSLEAVAGEFESVVVGEIVNVQPHPNADRLRICEVSIGATEPLRIVCGANNVRPGIRVPSALVGARLPGSLEIRQSEIRGEASFGMLCSEAELGLADKSDGLMELPGDAPIGEDIREYLQLNDSSIEVDLTPNRADCLSIEGIAREVALLNKMDWRAGQINETKIEHLDSIPVSVEAVDACPRYLGRLIKSVSPVSKTPLWMRERLRRSGIRSLSPLVDVTNYVLLELGQPLHAFDAAKIDGGITVRFGRAKEGLKLLNDQEIHVDEDILVIADDSRPLAFAGVMGGLESAVSDKAVDIFLECAYFSPAKIMGKARRYGLHTDSSHRFERGVDPNLQNRAIERATQLIIEISGGKAGPVSESFAPSALPEQTSVLLRAERAQMLLGIDLNTSEIAEILTRLGMAVKTETNGLRVTPPSFRFDIKIEADLIEELGRVYGYNRIPKRNFSMRAELADAPETRVEDNRIKDLLVDRGYQEAITYTFVDQDLQQKITPDLEAIALQNPISSDLSVMRTSLWCGLIQAAQRNINRQRTRIRLFEMGLRFQKRGETVIQEKSLAGLVTGHVLDEQWNVDEQQSDFFDIKSDLEVVFKLLRTRVRYFAAEHSALHPGQSARISLPDDTIVGWLGPLHPELETELGFNGQAIVFEVCLDKIPPREVPSFRKLSRFPHVRRDLALIVKESVTAEDLLQCVVNTDKKIIKNVNIFDVYRGQRVESGFKSVALAMILEDSSRTLKDSEIDSVVSEVLNELSTQFNATLRD